jgi:hypothetical protein
MIVLLVISVVVVSGCTESTTTPEQDTGQESPQQTDEASSDTESTDSTSENQETSTGTSEEQPDTENTRESRTHSIGSEFTVGDVVYQVNDVSTRERIGETTAGTFMGAEANGQYIIMDLSVINEADESITMSTSSVKVMIDGAEYSSSTDASIYMDESFSFEQLNPGVQVDGQIAYDVPESATRDSAELRVNPVGLFSTAEPHYVTLGS